jgi:ABC-2 type transport system permease protein
VVADAAPPRQSRARDRLLVSGFTPMRWIRDGARGARRGADLDTTREECSFEAGMTQPPPAVPDTAAASGPVWPFGLVFLVLAGLGATAIGILRTRTPVRRLPSGTRIA